MEENVTIEELEPKITETKLWNLNNFFIAFFIGVGFAILAIVLITYFNMNLVDSLILVLVLVVVYASILFFLLESKILREVEQTTIRTIDRPFIKEVPVEKEVIVEKPVEKKIFIDRPVIKEVEKKIFVDRPVEKKVSVEKEVVVDRPVDRPVVNKVYVPVGAHKEKIVIPKYNFIASTETMTYHTRNCRLGKLIKRKYKISTNSEKILKKRGFKPCKVCIPIKTKKKKKKSK